MSVPYAAIRAQVEQAQEKIRIAAGLFRKNGCDDSADHLMRSHAHLAVWTQRDGFLDVMESQEGEE